MAVKPAAEAKFEFSAPAVVIGAGACGLVAALSLKERGIDVLVLERDERPTGSTSLSAGLIPAAVTRFQREKGIVDSPAQFAADLRVKAHDENDPAIVAAVAEASGATIDWLADAQGVEMQLVEGFTYPGHSCLRMHGPKSQSGADLQSMLLAAADRAEIDILTDALVEDLYADEDGRIVAVAMRRPDRTVETVGCGALILACSGFGGAPALVKRHIPSMSEATYGGHTANQGHALAWGVALGAAAADLGSFQGHASIASPHGLQVTWAVMTHGGFQVNLAGERFADEMRGYSEQAEEVLRQPSGLAWDIYDARCEVSALGFHDYRELAAVGAIKQADSLAALAALIGLPQEVFLATCASVADYAAGRASDPLGRDFTGSPPLAPPYRAVKVTGALLHTQGGLVIDTRTRVRRADGTPMPNLFAGGGAARGLSGAAAYGYLSGNGLLSAVVLGRVAGLAAADMLAG